MAYVAPAARQSSKKAEAENLRRRASVAPTASVGDQPAMTALEWNSGMLTYDTSVGPRPTRCTRPSPWVAILPWEHMTALGEPVVPLVKMSR